MKEEPLLLLSDLQKLINQVVLIDYTIIILGGVDLNSKENKELYFERKMDTTLAKWKKDPYRQPFA